LHTCVAAVFLFALVGTGTARAQVQAPAPDTILVNGKLVVYDGAPAQALAVRDGRSQRSAIRRVSARWQAPRPASLISAAARSSPA